MPSGLKQAELHSAGKAMRAARLARLTGGGEGGGYAGASGASAGAGSVGFGSQVMLLHLLQLHLHLLPEFVEPQVDEWNRDQACEARDLMP